MWLHKLMSVAVLGTAFACPLAEAGALTGEAAQSNDAAAASVPLQDRDWSTTAKISIALKPPSGRMVESFLASTLGLLEVDAQQPRSIGVCSFGFYDLATDGVYRLVANLDPSGRHFCNQVVVVSKRIPAFYLEAWEPGSTDAVHHMVRDILSNHRLELVVPVLWSNYMGAANCFATWLHVYRITGSKALDVSRHFNSVYIDRLGELKGDLLAKVDSQIASESLRLKPVAVAPPRKIAGRLIPQNPQAVEEHRKISQELNERDDVMRSCITMEIDRIQDYLRV